MLTNLLIILLAILAAYVAYGLYHKQNMWKWIMVYWLVLTVKNFTEVIAHIS